MTRNRIDRKVYLDETVFPDYGNWQLDENALASDGSFLYWGDTDIDKLPTNDEIPNGAKAISTDKNLYILKTKSNGDREWVSVKE